MEISWAPWGDVSAVWKAVPQLKELRLRGSGGRLGPIDAAFLETLVIESGGLPLEIFDAVVEARLPGLSKLELWFGHEAYGAECTSSDVQRLLARPDTQLRSLGLRNANFTHELIPLLAKWKPLSSLRRLDLSLGVLSDADVDVLLEHRAAFAHLEALDLRENVMVMRMTEVERALPNALVGDQRDTERRGRPGSFREAGKNLGVTRSGKRPNSGLDAGGSRSVLRFESLIPHGWAFPSLSRYCGRAR
jgi:hypothetical protein